MRRRGLFGWMAGLMAAPVAVPSVAGPAPRSLADAVRVGAVTLSEARRLAGVEILGEPLHFEPLRLDGLPRHQVFGGEDLRPIAEPNWHALAQQCGSWAASEDGQPYGHCVPPRDFRAFMHERLGDMSMIP